MYKHRTHVFMSALGAALSAGAAAVATAFDQAEKFAVTGALKVTHIITEQVCDFDTLDQLEAYLNAVADRHHWFRHDQAAPGAAQDAHQVDTTAAQYDALAAAPADVASTMHVNLDLNQLRAGAAPADAITATVVTPDAPIAEPIAAPAEPVASVAPVEPTEPAAPAAADAPAAPATEQPAADSAAQ